VNGKKALRLEYDPLLTLSLYGPEKQKIHPLKFLPNLSISMKEYRLKP
jgi:hypothetical protein